MNNFYQFFKEYMAILGILLSLVPMLPQLYDSMPIYQSVKIFAGILGTVFCFLSIAIIYSLRLRIAIWCFPKGDDLKRLTYSIRILVRYIVPFFLFIIAIFAPINYLLYMEKSITKAALEQSYYDDGGKTLYDKLGEKGGLLESGRLFHSDGEVIFGKSEKGQGKDIIFHLKNFSKKSENAILENTPFIMIPFKLTLICLYVVMFMAPVSAFLWLGIVEYTQKTILGDDSKAIKAQYK